MICSAECWNNCSEGRVKWGNQYTYTDKGVFESEFLNRIGCCLHVMTADWPELLCDWVSKYQLSLQTLLHNFMLFWGAGTRNFHNISTTPTLHRMLVTISKLEDLSRSRQPSIISPRAITVSQLTLRYYRNHVIREVEKLFERRVLLASRIVVRVLPRIRFIRSSIDHSRSKAFLW